jgi:hypothetical protein
MPLCSVAITGNYRKFLPVKSLIFTGKFTGNLSEITGKIGNPLVELKFT